ncbi:MAG TPA: outer membrane beta-barrel protein [Dongiaceae bacterium]|nr:outer membrane beta-barrel protein [Dongiaceae bacterium]
MTRKLINLLIASSALTGTAQADLLDPAPVKLGGTDVTPQLMLAEEYDDNFYRQLNTQEFWVQILTLQVDTLTPVGADEYSAHYKVEGGFIEDSSDDNYVDQSLSLRGFWDSNSRHRFELKGGFAQEHEARGSENFQGSKAFSIDEPPEFDQASVLARYSYGAAGARGRLDLELKGSDKTYQNLRELTERSDRTNAEGTATFFWRLAGVWKGLVEVSHGEYDYTHDLEPREGAIDSSDNDYTHYLAGVTWEAAGKTSGTLKAGRSEKNFSDDDREDFSGNRWYGDIQWQPRTYSTFKLLTERRTEEPPLDRGDYIAVTDWGIDWRHEWNDRIASRLHYLRSEEVFKGDPEGRRDTPEYYGFSVEYGIRRWAVVRIFYVQDDHKSNIEEFDYPHGISGLAFRASL